MNRALDLVILGSPGAGKGTQARRIASAFDVAHVSTGDMLRDEVAQGTELGKSIQAVMAQGELVSDDLMATVLLGRLHSPQGVAGCVFDGYPRNAAQAHLLDGLLAELGRRIDVVLYLDVPDHVVLERITGRRSCSGCGTTYHLAGRPSRLGDRCELCNDPLVQRDDDREEVIRERLRVYGEHTAPLLTLYRERGVLHEVDGVGSEEAVFSRLRSAMGSGGR